MKKLLFVAIIAAAMVSCTETTTTVVNQDSIDKARIEDSLKNLTPMVDTTMTPKMDSTTIKTDSTSK